MISDHRAIQHTNTVYLIYLFYLLCYTNLIKIKYPTSSDLLIARGVGDLKKPHQWSHVVNTMNNPMKFAIAIL